MTGQTLRPEYIRPWSVSGPLARVRLLLAAVLAGGALVVLLVGPPTALAMLGGPPWAVVRGLLEQPDVDGLLGSVQHVLLLGGWLGWGLLLMRFLEASRDVRQALIQTNQPRSRGRLGARGLIAGLILAPLASPVSALAAAQGTSAAAGPVAGEVEKDRMTATQPAAQAHNTQASREVRVQAWGRTATLWGLAEKYLGEGTRWREIWELNDGRQQSDGTVMRSPSFLVPGWTVLIPEPPRTASGTSKQRLHYSIAEGDRLGDIAVRYLGEFDGYRRIQRANQDSISDPDRIEAGASIVLPAEARDRGRLDHARGHARNLERDPAPTENFPATPEIPPSRNTPELDGPRSKSPMPEAERPAQLSERADEGDVEPWVLPAVTAATAGLVAVGIGRRRSRKKNPDGPADEATQIEAEDDWEDDEDVDEADVDEEERNGALHSDAAIDAARSIIHQTSAQLRLRQEQATGAQQHFDAGTLAPEPPPLDPAPQQPGHSPRTELVAAGDAGAASELGAGPSKRVQVKLFGDPAILDLQGNRVHGLRRHGMQLLLYLALNRGGTELNVLRELMWAEISMSKATSRLSTEVASLRRTVRVALGDAENLRINAVDNRNGTYELADFVITDVQAFDSAMAAASAYPKDSVEREQALRSAVALHTGPLADRNSLNFDWLQPHRRRLNRAGAEARVLLAETVHAREPDEARALLREAGRLDPADRILQEQIVRITRRFGF